MTWWRKPMQSQITLHTRLKTPLSPISSFLNNPIMHWHLHKPPAMGISTSAARQHSMSRASYLDHSVFHQFMISGHIWCNLQVHVNSSVVFSFLFPLFSLTQQRLCTSEKSNINQTVKFDEITAILSLQINYKTKPTVIRKDSNLSSWLKALVACILQWSLLTLIVKQYEEFQTVTFIGEHRYVYGEYFCCSNIL